VLLRVEPAPSGLPVVVIVGGAGTEVRLRRAKDALDGRITIRYVQTGDLVVTVVLLPNPPNDESIVAEASRPSASQRVGCAPDA
jgi:hypothetical protein